jgi:hypothetical protein
MKNEDDMFQNPKVEQVLRETARIFREKVMFKSGKIRQRHFNPMLGLMSGTIDVLSHIEEGVQKAYACPRGHTFKTSSPIVVAVDDDPEYNTGPICGYCYVDWFKANLNANEVLEDY